MCRDGWWWLRWEERTDLVQLHTQQQHYTIRSIHYWYKLGKIVITYIRLTFIQNNMQCTFNTDHWDSTLSQRTEENVHHLLCTDDNSKGFACDPKVKLFSVCRLWLLSWSYTCNVWDEDEGPLLVNSWSVWDRLWDRLDLVGAHIECQSFGNEKREWLQKNPIIEPFPGLTHITNELQRQCTGLCSSFTCVTY